jgi:hypothetical protein
VVAPGLGEVTKVLRTSSTLVGWAPAILNYTAGRT